MGATVEVLERSSLLDKIKGKITGAIGYLLPLVASIPPIAAWGGLMTVPFAIYLIMMFLNLTEIPLIPDLMNPQVLVIITIQFLCVTFLLWSIIHLLRRKSSGLVTSGPYRIVRHPQYFALIIFTFFMAFDSIWILQHTFGIGWLSVEQTKLLWIGMLVAYVIIAKVEELHLETTFNPEWNDYKSRVGFLLPLIGTKSHFVESILAVSIPYALLEIALYIMA